MRQRPRGSGALLMVVAITGGLAVSLGPVVGQTVAQAAVTSPSAGRDGSRTPTWQPGAGGGGTNAKGSGSGWNSESRGSGGTGSGSTWRQGTQGTRGPQSQGSGASNGGKGSGGGTRGQSGTPPGLQAGGTSGNPSRSPTPPTSSKGNPGQGKGGNGWAGQNGKGSSNGGSTTNRNSPNSGSGNSGTNPRWPHDSTSWHSWDSRWRDANFRREHVRDSHHEHFEDVSDHRFHDRFHFGEFRSEDQDFQDDCDSLISIHSVRELLDYLDSHPWLRDFFELHGDLFDFLVHHPDMLDSFDSGCSYIDVY
jgi:hypothetical protein